MSATFAFVIDTGDSNFRKSDSRELFTRVGDSFVTCMGLKGQDQAAREVRRVAVDGLSLIELEGPWDAICYAGASTLQLDFWGEVGHLS